MEVLVDKNISETGDARGSAGSISHVHSILVFCRSLLERLADCSGTFTVTFLVVT